MDLTEKKDSIKARCKEILDLAKAEIRELSEGEEREISDAKKELEAINQEMREMEEKEKEAPEEEVKEEPSEEVKEEEKPDNEESDEVEEKPENKENNKRSNNIIMNTEFRLLSAIRDIANNRGLDNLSSAVNEKGKEEMRKCGINAGGQIQLPVSEIRDITVANEGEDVVEVKMYDILEPLRAKNVLAQAGCHFLSGLVGDVQIPSMSAANVNWEGEVAPAKDAAQKFDHIKLQPKRISAYIDLSKQFLVQDSLSAEALIRQDLINAINSKLEATILGTESGTTTMPEGIFYTTGTTATISDFKGVCEAEAAVEDANVFGECKYIMSNKAKAAFRNMAKSAKTNELVFQNGTIDGTPVLNTSNVKDKYVAFGDWSQLYIGQWGSIDLTVDPYTLAKDGKVRLVINAFFDAKVVRPGAIVTRKVA